MDQEMMDEDAARGTKRGADAEPEEQSESKRQEVEQNNDNNNNTEEEDEAKKQELLDKIAQDEADRKFVFDDEQRRATLKTASESLDWKKVLRPETLSLWESTKPINGIWYVNFELGKFHGDDGSRLMWKRPIGNVDSYSKRWIPGSDKISSKEKQEHLEPPAQKKRLILTPYISEECRRKFDSVSPGQTDKMVQEFKNYIKTLDLFVERAAYLMNRNCPKIREFIATKVANSYSKVPNSGLPSGFAISKVPTWSARHDLGDKERYGSLLELMDKEIHNYIQVSWRLRTEEEFKQQTKDWRKHDDDEDKIVYYRPAFIKNPTRVPQKTTDISEKGDPKCKDPMDYVNYAYRQGYDLVHPNLTIGKTGKPVKKRVPKMIKNENGVEVPVVDKFGQIVMEEKIASSIPCVDIPGQNDAIGGMDTMKIFLREETIKFQTETTDDIPVVAAGIRNQIEAVIEDVEGADEDIVY